MLEKEIEQDATVLIPQNAEWTNTSKMVKKISEANGRNIAMVKAMWPILVLAGKVPGKISSLINKAFGNNCYALAMSEYEGICYQIISVDKSIERTEGRDNH